MRIFEQSRELARFTPSTEHARARAAHLQGDPLTTSSTAGRDCLPALAWLALSRRIVELCAREVARRSLVEHGSPVMRPACSRCCDRRSRRGRRCPVACRTGRHGRAGRRTALLFAALFAVGLAFQLQLGARLQSDGFYYFAYLRSLAFDRRRRFHERLHAARPRRQAAPVPAAHPPATRSQRVDRPGDPVGAVLRAPATSSPRRLAAHRPRRRRQRHLVSVPAGGLRRRAVLRSARLLVLLSADARCSSTRAGGGSRPRSPSAAPFMLWYLVKEPSMTHGPSMAAVAGFVWAWVATRDGRTTPAMGAGSGVHRRVHDAHPLAERALRAAAGVRRASPCWWPPRARRTGGA